MLSALLGPYAGFLTMIGVLLIQCLFFADGGLMALGANVWNMAFYGCFIGALLIWKPMMKGGVTKKKITIASILGCILTLEMGAFSVTIQTLLSGITELPFKTFVGTMLPIHLAIGLVEGLITAAVLCFVHESRPELIWTGNKAAAGEGKLSFKGTIAVLTIAALLIAGGLSLFASSHPDGLEWSMEKVAGTAELEGEGAVIEASGKVAEIAPLPDYAFPNSESAAGTTTSGIVGSLIVLGVCVGAGYAFKFFKGGANKKIEQA